MMSAAPVGRGASRPGADAADRVFHALADPTRRAILDALRERAHTTGELAARFPMSRFGVMKHLKVLDEAGLLRVERRGRERWNHLDPVPIQRIHRRWILPFESDAADKLLRLERTLKSSPRRRT